MLVVTRRRPKMLGELLTTLQALNLPKNCEVFFIVVDNDDKASAFSAYEHFSRIVGREHARYFCEPRMGIPRARNRALDEAVALDARLGAFIDDDEMAHPDWLAELVIAYRKRNLDLIGGPIRPVPWTERDALTVWQKVILNGVQWRYRRKERRAERKAIAGDDHDVVIVTNNWMIDLSWWCGSRLRFDESLQFSGGSDALFYKLAKSLGLRSGWCATAIVRESTPASRLSFRHQFKRARSQANSGFYRKYANRSAIVVATTLVSCGLKVVGAIGCLAVAPLRPGPAVVQGARALGWIVGRLDALSGRRSRYYLNVDGA